MIPHKPRQNIKRTLTKIAVFILGDGGLLRFGVAGKLARLVRLPESVYRPHPYTLYELNPSWRSPSGKSRHNQSGFRGPEITDPKPAGTIRVVCMGESTTYCTGIDADADTYPARLEKHVKDFRPDLEIEVINAGVGGYTSLENLIRCVAYVAPLSPDAIIYYYTHNDVHPRCMPKISRDYHEYSRSWYEPRRGMGFLSWLVRRWSLASGIIGRLVRRDYEQGFRRSDVSFIRHNSADAFKTNMTALALLSQATGARLMIVNPPYRELKQIEVGNKDVSPRALAVWEHRKIIEEVGKRLGFAVYDLAERMPFPADTDFLPNELYLDPVHVTEKGADIMARLIAEAALAHDLLAPDKRPDRLFP